MTAIASPTVTAYKRYQVGTWAPVQIAWGIENRTALVRALPDGAGHQDREPARQLGRQPVPARRGHGRGRPGRDPPEPRTAGSGQREPVREHPLPAAACQPAPRAWTRWSRTRSWFRPWGRCSPARSPTCSASTGSATSATSATGRSANTGKCCKGQPCGAESTDRSGALRRSSRARPATVGCPLRPARAEVCMLSLPMVPTFRSAYGRSAGRKRLIVVRLEDERRADRMGRGADRRAPAVLPGHRREHLVGPDRPARCRRSSGGRSAARPSWPAPGRT